MPRLRPRRRLADAAEAGREGGAAPRAARPRASARRPLAPLHRPLLGRRQRQRRAPASRPGELAVELALQRRREAAADGGTLGDAGRDQVRAVDLERDVAPLAQVAVEPLAPSARASDQLDGLVAARRARPPPRALRLAPRPARLVAAARPRAPRRRSAAVARCDSPPRAGRRAARRPGDQLERRPAAARPAPTRRAARSPRGALGSAARRSSSASRRSAETVSRSVARSSASVSGSSSKPRRAA